MIVRTYSEGIAALAKMERVRSYIAQQFSPNMRRDEALAHFEARNLLLRLSLTLLDEIEQSFKRDQVIH